MDNMNEFIYSYIYTLSIFYCNNLERKDDMKDNIDLEDLIKMQKDTFQTDNSFWFISILVLALFGMDGFEKHKDSTNIHIHIGGDK
jgi:hypothetical protein